MLPSLGAHYLETSAFHHRPSSLADQRSRVLQRRLFLNSRASAVEPKRGSNQIELISASLRADFSSLNHTKDTHPNYENVSPIHRRINSLRRFGAGYRSRQHRQERFGSPR